MSSKKKSKCLRTKFTPGEDEKLRSLVKNIGLKNWKEISDHMPGRTSRQCRERWKHYLSIDCAKKAWTYMDDMMLLEKYKAFGPKWTTIANFFPGRSDIQIKTRIKELDTMNAEKNRRPVIYYANTPPQVYVQPIPVPSYNGPVIIQMNPQMIQQMPPIVQVPVISMANKCQTSSSSNKNQHKK